MNNGSNEVTPLGARARRPVFLAFALVLFALAQQAWRAPTWGWDILGYAGAVEEASGADPAAIHGKVYAELDQLAPAEVANDLRQGIAYREQVSSDPHAFHAQLRFYRGRVVYIGLLAGLENLGLPPLRGAFLISVVAGLVFGLLLALLLMRLLPPSLAVVAALLVTYWGGGREVMSMATPDMLASAFLLGGVLALFEVRSPWVAVSLFVLALGTRADHIFLVGPLLLWASIFPGARGEKISRGELSTALVLCAGTFWLCTAGRDTYSWWTVFHHTFIEYMAFPTRDVPEIDLGLAVSRALRSLPMFKALQPLVYGLVAASACVLGWRLDRFRSRSTTLGLLVLAAMLLHFALFPALWPRLMLPYWTLALVGLCLVWREGRRTEETTR